MRRKATLLALTVVLGLSGCKREVAAPRAVHAESGLEVIPLTITHLGQRHTFKVELAQSAKEQEAGLMFRTRLGPDEGMLFPIEPPRPASFWMRNTVIPLDLLFIAPDGRIANIAANARPYDESRLVSIGPAEAVLELPGGRAAALGIVPGDTAEW